MGGCRKSQIMRRFGDAKRAAGTALILRDTSMTRDTLTTNVDRHGDEYPPSRPGPKTLIGALVVILAGLAIAFWPQILGAMGIHVAPPGAGG
jgi:hypothetical protein